MCVFDRMRFAREKKKKIAIEKQVFIDRYRAAHPK